MSVAVHFPPELSPDHSDTLRLRRCYDDEYVEDTLTVQIEKLLHHNKSSTVYVFSGCLSLSSEPLAASTAPVVCKITYDKSWIDRLSWEAFMYHNLHNLQGQVIPRLYGYFEKEDFAGCLILQHAGEPLETCFEDLGDLRKYAAVHTILGIEILTTRPRLGLILWKR